MGAPRKAAWSSSSGTLAQEPLIQTARTAKRRRKGRKWVMLEVVIWIEFGE